MALYDELDHTYDIKFCSAYGVYEHLMRKMLSHLHGSVHTQTLTHIHTITQIPFRLLLGNDDTLINMSVVKRELQSNLEGCAARCRMQSVSCSNRWASSTCILFSAPETPSQNKTIIQYV